MEKAPKELKVLIVVDCGTGRTKLMEALDRFKEENILAFEKMGASFDDAATAFRVFSDVHKDMPVLDFTALEELSLPFINEAAIMPKSELKLLSNNLAKEMKKIKKASKLAETKGNEIWRNKWDKKIKRKI